MNQSETRHKDLLTDSSLTKSEPPIRLGHGDEQPKKDEDLPPAP